MLEKRIKDSAEYKEFTQSLAHGGLSHAYLVLGADATVRALFVKMFASVILCPEKGCGECPVCEKVFSDCHPDVKVYNKDGKFRVHDATMLIEDAYIKGWESETKLYFIDNAETLMPQSQNKLLKIYEEPPKGVVMFLLAGSEGGLLQTVVSRAKKVYLPTFTCKDIYEELLEDGYPHKTAETASALSGARFDKAYLYAQNEDYPKLYDECFDTLLKCKSSRDIPSFTGRAMFGKENLPVTLDILEVILNDVMRLTSASGIPRSSHNRDYDLAEISKGFSPGGVAMALLSLNKARKMLAFYVSAAGIADTILFEILEAKYKWQ
ncbi:MAG: hypothetical protein PHI19_04610 [Clostridia bacterium]|nr:hypothetical protein [Clostridia bacterium]